MSDGEDLEGLLVVNKPAGCTSHDVVGQVRRALHQRKIGHGGTLDPDATGVLLLGVGPATRLLRFVSDLDKSYTAEVVLGTATSTLDASGSVTATAEMSAVTLEDAQRAAATLTGEIDQVPPMVSAIKIGGRRLYELARAGEEVERPPRRVLVSRFAVEETETGGVLRVEVDCSSGTYVRTLAADLGEALGGVAHLRSLVRTRIGPFHLAEASPLDEVGPVRLRPAGDLVSHLDGIDVDGELASMVLHGRVLPRSVLGADGSGPWRVVRGDELLAVYAAHKAETVKPILVYAPEQRLLTIPVAAGLADMVGPMGFDT